MIFYLLALELFLAALAIALLGLRAKKGIRRSAWWGVRTRATMASSEAFAVANRAVWVLYLIISAILAAEGVAVLMIEALGGSYELMVIVILAGGGVVLLLAALQVLIAHRRAS